MNIDLKKIDGLLPSGLRYSDNFEDIRQDIYTIILEQEARSEKEIKECISLVRKKYTHDYYDNKYKLKSLHAPILAGEEGYTLENILAKTNTDDYTKKVSSSVKPLSDKNSPERLFLNFLISLLYRGYWNSSDVLSFEQHFRFFNKVYYHYEALFLINAIVTIDPWHIKYLNFSSISSFKKSLRIFDPTYFKKWKRCQPIDGFIKRLNDTSFIIESSSIVSYNDKAHHVFRVENDTVYLSCQKYAPISSILISKSKEKNLTCKRCRKIQMKLENRSSGIPARNSKSPTLRTNQGLIFSTI